MKQNSSSKRWKTIGMVLFLALFFGYSNLYAQQAPLKLWYNFPATNWMTSALPIGNGCFGGMFFGGVAQEHMQFNDKTLWTGSTTVRGAYQNFGDLYLNFTTPTASTEYRRELSLDEAIGRVSYKDGDVSYSREYFASNPDNVIVMRLTSSATEKLSFTVNLADAHTGTTVYAGNNITMSGKLDLVSYEAQVQVLNEGGTLTTASNQITIANADAVTILLTGATNFSLTSATYLGETSSDLHTRVSNSISAASAKTYQQLKTNHLNDYQTLFNRVKLDLNQTMPNVPTDVLVRSYKDNAYLDVLYYQYGRYLMIGSSRGLSLPSNLQGLWNDNNNPSWQCDIHSNINVQMNYWLAENANLSELHIPYLDYVATEALKTNGSWQKMASTVITSTDNGEKMTGYRGWTIRTQSNIFGYSDWNWNRPANAWYCTHLWQHYAYTKDLNYLKDKAFPTMKSACEFWFDRLKTDANGKLIAPDEWSPEHGTWEDNIAYAQQLIWELFDNTLKAANLIQADATFISTLTSKLALLDNGVKVGSWGQIKEWTTQTDVQGDTHRHLSHLMALYPGNQISPLKDKTYSDAAAVSLNSRGDGGTGWSRAWKISCWARLQDGNHAYKLCKAAQNLTTYTSVSMTDGLGGVYENLFDAHPSFQIDGNFGFTAGVTEMLIQSNQGFIQVLPALPTVWANGSYIGLRAIGNFTVDLNWKSSLPQKAVIYSGSGEVCKMYYPAIKVASLLDESGNPITYETTATNLISFATVVGKKYTLTFDNDLKNAPTLTPYVQINKAAKTQASSVQVGSKEMLTLSPQSTIDAGTWDWTSSNGFSATTKEITLSGTTLKSGNYIVTQTVNGVKAIQVFNVIVAISTPTSKLNVLAVGDYYIKKAGTQTYWTNTNVNGTGGNPSFTTKTGVDAQIWTVSLDGGTYKIVSKADSRYINERGNFGTNSYYQDWNTFNLYNDSIYTAVQITAQSANSAGGTYFWSFNTDNTMQYSSNSTIDETKDLILEFIPVKKSNAKKNIVPSGGYYIKKKSKDLYWTVIDAVSSSPSFAIKQSPKTAKTQVCSITFDGTRYKIANSVDKRYLNEFGDLGTETFDATKHTYTIYTDDTQSSGTYHAIQIPQNGEYFWSLNQNNSIEYLTTSSIDEADPYAFAFELIPVTYADTFYVEPVAIHEFTKSKIEVWSSSKTLYVQTDSKSRVSIYSVLGVLCKQQQVEGFQMITLSDGVYLVEVENDKERKTIKVVIY